MASDDSLPILWHTYGAFRIMPSLFPVRWWKRRCSPNEWKTCVACQPLVIPLLLYAASIRSRRLVLPTPVDANLLVFLLWFKHSLNMFVIAADQLTLKSWKNETSFCSWRFCKTVSEMWLLFTCNLIRISFCFQPYVFQEFSGYIPAKAIKWYAYLTSHWLFISDEPELERSRWLYVSATWSGNYGNRFATTPKWLYFTERALAELRVICSMVWSTSEAYFSVSAVRKPCADGFVWQTCVHSNSVHFSVT